MISEEDRKYILSEFLRLISHIQDREYQKRVWIYNQGPECQAFDDAVCDFFDDGDPILNNYKEYGITNSQYEILMKFREKFDVFSDENDLPEEFIDTPEWKEIMNQAKEVLKAFNYKKPEK